ncbi:MAG: hypothetical protein AAFY48_16030 [Bacteroidota bacterium]
MNPAPLVLHSGLFIRNYSYTKVSMEDMASFLSALPLQESIQVNPHENNGTYQDLRIGIKLTEIPDWFCLSTFCTEEDLHDFRIRGDKKLREWVTHLMDNLQDQFNLFPYEVEFYNPKHTQYILAKGSRNLSRSHLVPFVDIITEPATATQKSHQYSRLKESMQSQLSDIKVKEVVNEAVPPAVISYAVCDRYDQFSHLEHFLKLRWFALDLDFNLFWHNEDLLFVPLTLSEAIQEIISPYLREYFSSIPDIQEIYLDETGESVSFFTITANSYILYWESPFFDYL